MTDTTKTEALRLADSWLERAKHEASRRNSAYDYYGMGNTPESVDPEGARMAAELRRLSKVESAFNALIAAIGDHQVSALIEKHGGIGHE